MSLNYVGRLGRITKRYPKLCCKGCGTQQVQIINYLKGDPKYKCRICKRVFTMPFEDTLEELEEDENTFSSCFE